jgi:hypothetical protein
MSSRKGVLRGRKVSSKHSTFSPEAAFVIKTAKKEPGVTRVVPAQITGRGGKRNIKIQKISVGLKVVVRGSTGAQVVWVYTSAQDSVEQILREAWAKAGW